MTVRSRTALVLVEYHSGGLVQERARDGLAHGLVVVVADNSGSYVGPGLVVPMEGNVGFGAACNAAVAALPPDVDVLVLHNPDASIPIEDLDRLIDSVRSGPWVAVAPALRTRTELRPQGFAVPGLLRELALVPIECFGLRTPQLLAYQSRFRRGGRERAVSDHRPVASTGRFASAALLVVSREAFESIGGFDERYFLYVEDLDLWERLRRESGPVGFVSSLVADHDAGTGSRAPDTRRTLLRWLGRELFAEKTTGTWRWHRLLHRMGALSLTSDDHIAQFVRRGLRSSSGPATLLGEVRAAETGAPAVSEAKQQWSKISVGWSRTRVRVREADVLLDVGSGAFPNPRADVLCERTLVRPHRLAVADRPIVVADAEHLPFRKGAFDVVVASHLAEHVENPGRLCNELVRVATRGYVETPSPTFERLFPSGNHRWKVGKVGKYGLSFVPNEPQNRFLERCGRRLYPWYFAGTERERPVRGLGASRHERLLVYAAYVIRGTLNRAGLTVTRASFDGQHPLHADVSRSR